MLSSINFARVFNSISVLLLGEWMNNSAGLAFSPHVITVGVDEVVIFFHYFVRAIGFDYLFNSLFLINPKYITVWARVEFFKILVTPKSMAASNIRRKINLTCLTKKSYLYFTNFQKASEK